jgi:acyl-CoA thioester hydrolase
MSRIALPRDISAYGWSVELQTRFGDMDKYSHLNNVAIARLFEETRIRFNDFLAERIVDFWQTQFVIVHASLDYLAEVRYPAPVLVGQRVTAIGTTSFTTGAAMFQGGACVAQCLSVLVTRDSDGPISLPAALRSGLQAVKDSQQPIGEMK